MKGWLGLAVAVAVAVVVVLPSAAAQVLTPSQCENQKNNIESTCKSVVGGSASEACCKLLRDANLECVCPYVTPKVVAAVGGAARAIQIVQDCGRTIPKNYKCGSLTTPP